MSFLAPKPDIPTDSAPERQSYEATGPVPVGFGRVRVGLKLLEAPFNHWQFNHGDRKPKGNCYTIVAAGCHGPVRGVFRLWMNGKPMWQFQCMREGAEMYRDISYSYAEVSWYARIYWGDPNQPADPFLNGTAVTMPSGHRFLPPRKLDGSARAHPPYAGIFYIIFYSLHFDFPNDNSGQTTLPSMEAEVLVAPQTNIAVSDAVLQSHGANPIMVAYDLLTNPVYGADLPSSLVASADWISKAQALNDNGYHNQAGGAGNLAPVWADNRTLAQTLGDLFSYYDGFVRLKNGRLLPDYFPNQSYDPGALTTLTRNDCLEEADVDPEGWEDTLSEMTIKYRSNGLLEEEAITERSTYNLRITDRGARKAIDAPFIIHSTQARRMAQRELSIKSQPGFKARLKVMRERARNPDGSLLMPGDLVYLNYEPYALQMLCRIIEREDRRGEVTLNLVNERGKYAEDFVAQPDERLLPKIEDPGTVANWRVLELPEELAGTGWPPKLAVLAQRPNSSVLAAVCYLSKTGAFAGEEQQLASITAFAVRASLVGSIVAGDTQLTFSVADPDPDLAMYRDYTAAEQANGYVMAMIGNELISLGTIVPDVGTNWTFTASRGVFGTTAGSHTTGAEIFIFKREWLPMMAVEHELLKWSMPYTEAGATVYLRLAAANGWEVGDPNTAKTIVLRERASQDTPLPQFTVFAWRRSTTTPTAPTGGTYEEPAPTAAGWALTQPTGTDPLWMSRRTYYSDQDPTAWTDPVRVSGQDGASPRVYTIVPSAAVIVFDDPDFDPVSITATAYVTVGNVRSVVSSQEAYLVSDVYRSGVWNQISLPYDLVAGDQRVRFVLEEEGSAAVLAEVIVPVVTAGQTGPQGEPGETGASTLMAFGRFLDQPATPTGTGAPPSASWSLDSENAPGNSIYPLWVTVGTRPQGGLQWTWQLPFRFTPEKGDTGDTGAPGTDGLSTAHLTVYRRSSVALTVAPTGGSYNFDTLTLTPPLNWSGEIPTGTDALYACTTMAAIPGASGIDSTLVWTAPRKIAENGQAGVSTAQLFVYKRSTNTSLLETPSGGSYSFDTLILTPPSSPIGWQATIPSDASAGIVYVSTATAAVVGASGTDNTLFWTQSRRLTDDMILADGSIDASKLAPNSVTADKIAAGAVVAAKIAAGAIEADKIAANAITADKIAAGAITAAKIDVANLAAIKATTGHLTVDGSVTSGAYSAGVTGWRINADGTAEFNQLTLRKGIVSADDILFYDPSNLVYDSAFLEGTAGFSNGGADGWTVWGWDDDSPLDIRGQFDQMAYYYHNDVNGRSIVKQNNLWWIANNPAKSGTIGYNWNTPGSGNDWAFFSETTGTPDNWGGGANPQFRGWRWVPDVTIASLGNTGEPAGYPAMWINPESNDGTEDIYWTRSLLHNKLVVPVMPGDVLHAKARVLGSRVHVAIDFFNIAGTASGWFATAVGNTIDASWSAWRISEVVAVAPPNAAYARLLVFKQGRFSHAAVSRVSMRRIEGASLLSTSIPAPQIPTASQSFTGSITVLKPESITGLTLRYSLTGAVMPESPEWTADLTVSGTTTLRARWFNAFGFSGPETERVYTATAAPPATLPLPSVDWSGVDPFSVTKVTRLYVPADTAFSYLRYRVIGGSWVNGSAGVNNWTLNPVVLLDRYDGMEIEAVSDGTKNNALETFYATYRSDGGGNLEP